MVLVASVMDEIAVEEKGSGTGDGGPVLKTRFQQELFIWDLAMTRLEQASQEKKQEPKDRILRQFLQFKREGQLETALFLLRYKEAFRPDFEAWKKKNPGGIAAFINRYGIRP